MKLVILTLVMLILAGCSNAPLPTQRIDASNDVQSCKVSSTITECTFINGNTYYMSSAAIAKRTIWDESAWKENIAYCPLNTILANLTNVSLQCPTIKVCNNNGVWQECP